MSYPVNPIEIGVNAPEKANIPLATFLNINLDDFFAIAKKGDRFIFEPSLAAQALGSPNDGQASLKFPGQTYHPLLTDHAGQLDHR